jgi:hypothetical protein
LRASPSRLHDLQPKQKTIQKAIPVAKKNQSEVVIHGRDGKIRDKDSYGNDPHPPRDKKH